MNRLCFLSFLILVLGCQEEIQEEPEAVDTIKLTVTSTAYNSVESQTKKGNIGLAAWGDILEPGEKAIAGSRDLIDMGLGHNAVVEIEGLDGIYIVKDKMNKRWEKKIDIYMGQDEDAAIEWGKQKVEIEFLADTE